MFELIDYYYLIKGVSKKRPKTSIDSVALDWYYIIIISIKAITHTFL
jgi:hypothetical protein